MAQRTAIFCGDRLDAKFGRHDVGFAARPESFYLRERSDMPQGNAAAVKAIDRLEDLLSPGLIGFYDDFEITEIVAFAPAASSPINVLTIMVGEEKDASANTDGTGTQFLGPRIAIKSMRGWKFGVMRYRLAAEIIPSLFRSLIEFDEWRPTGVPLKIGRLTPSPPLFVPPDGTTTVPLNGILKNNFWAGSHVIEWRDEAKTDLLALLTNPYRLQELSEAVLAVTPLKLASLSDRLGNILVQFPVTVLRSKQNNIPLMF